MVKALMKCSGTEEASEEAGEDGGDGEQGKDSREVVLMLKSRASSASTGSVLRLKVAYFCPRLSCFQIGAGLTNTGGRRCWYLW